MSKQSKKIALHREQNSLCFLCDEHLTLAESTIEHIVPVAHGGSDLIKNLAVSHAKCNAKRGTLPIAVFRKFLEYKKRSREFHRSGLSMGRWLKLTGWKHDPTLMQWVHVDENAAVPNTEEVQPVKQNHSTPSTRVEAVAKATVAKRLATPLGVFASGVGSPCTCSKLRNFFCIGKGYCCEACWRDYEGMNRWDGHWHGVLK